MAQKTKLRPIINVSTASKSALFPGELINGDIINGYLRLIERRGHEDPRLPRILCLDTFFVTALRAGGTERAARFHKGINLKMFENIFVPVHEPKVEPNGHWWLVCIDVGKRQISSYDSLTGIISHRATLGSINEHLVSQGMGKKEDWQLWECRTCPTQTNDRDCGIYLCEFVDVLSRGIDLKGYDLDPLDTRKRIARTIRDCEAKTPAAPTLDVRAFSGEEVQWEFEELCEELQKLTDPESWNVPGFETTDLEGKMEVVDEHDPMIFNSAETSRQSSSVLSLSSCWSLTKKQEATNKKKRRRTMKVHIPGTDKFKRVNVIKLGLRKIN